MAHNSIEMVCIDQTMFTEEEDVLPHHKNPSPSLSERNDKGDKRWKKGKPPFQLCFALNQVRGKSKLPKRDCSVTGKFYSVYDYCSLTKDDIEREIIRIQKEEEEHQLKKDILESQNYGRHPEPLLKTNRRDKRFNHHLFTSDMVKTECLLLNEKKSARMIEQMKK